MIWFDVDTALAEVPVNILPLVDDTDFKSIEASVTYNAAGLTLLWNFVTCAGAFTQTAVTPTDTGGDYDWVAQGNGMYTIEIPASAGASANNNTEGFGWFTGVATGVLPWRGPVIGFRAAGLNDALVESAYSATRGLSGTALPDAAADASGGLPIKSSLATAADITDAIFDVTTAFGISAGAIIIGTVTTGASTTEFECTDITNATSNLWKTVMGIFQGNVTAALTGVRFLITAYSKVGSNGHFTVTTIGGDALPAAPASGDKLVLV